MAIKICFDAGHGGNDPGAIGPRKTEEEDITLAVCKKAASYLPSDFTAIFTRTADKTTPLTNRTNYANKQKAAALVSVHCNAAASAAAHGVETYFYKAGTKGANLAAKIHAKIVPATGLTDRGCKAKNLHMCREADMPACLVELAFISNTKEEALLKSADFQSACAKAIVEGICEYFGKEVDDVRDIRDVELNGKVFKNAGEVVNGKSQVNSDVVKAMGAKIALDGAIKVTY